MARLPYLEADQVAPEYRDMLKRNTNLHKLLVNSPDMARAFNGIGSFIRFKSKLDPRLRELANQRVSFAPASVSADPPTISIIPPSQAQLLTGKTYEEAAKILAHARENRTTTYSYDTNGILFENSWGTGWGEAGYFDAAAAMVSTADGGMLITGQTTSADENNDVPTSAK